METTPSAGALAENKARIKQVFDQPQTYLSRTAYNITLRAEIVREFLQGRPTSSILDIGCGDGTLSRSLLNGENRLTLFDQSASMLEIARSRLPAQLLDRVRIITGDCMRTDFAPGEFDVIICVGVLAYIHIGERREFIARLSQALKPVGSLIIECTDSAHFVSALGRAYQKTLDLLKPSKISTIQGTSRQVMGLCGEAGLSLVSSFRYSLPLPLMNRLMSQKASYNAIRRVHGSSARNTFPWLGNECLFHYESPSR